MKGIWLRTGMYVIIIKATRVENKNGKQAFTVSPNFTFAMFVAAYRQTPTGGVDSPITRLMQIIMPV